MSNPVRILSISDDDGLRQSRELLLLTYGFDVTSTSSDTPISVMQVRSFPFALICRSVSSERVMALVDMLRRYNPEIQILRIAPLDDDDVCDTDFNLSPTPEALLAEVRYICSGQAETQKYRLQASLRSHDRNLFRMINPSSMFIR